MHTLINSCLISSGRCTHLLTLGLAGRGRDGEAAPGAANPPILRITGTNTEKTASRRTGGAQDICSHPQPRLRAVLQQQEESAAHGMHISRGVPPSGAPQHKQTGCYPPPQLCQKAMGEQTAQTPSQNPGVCQGETPERGSSAGASRQLPLRAPLRAAPGARPGAKRGSRSSEKLLV